MQSVGLFEIKNRLSAFVERASQGEEITITRRGQPVAMLVPAAGRSELHRIEALVEKDRALLLRGWHDYFGN